MVLAGAVLTACGGGTPPNTPDTPAPGDTAHSVVVAGPGGGVRHYDLHLPTPRPAGAMPLVLAFHGALSDPLVMAQETHLDRIADAHGFVVAYPAGYHETWNEGAGHTPAEVAGIDDVSFTATLLDTLEARYRIDTTRVAVAGLSNGALLTELLGCRLAGRISLVVPVAGPLPVSVAPGCHPSQPVSVLAVHGTADPTVPYAGGQVHGVGGGTQVLSAPASAATWARLDRCATRPTARPLHHGSDVTVDTYARCAQGTVVELVTVAGGGHTWPAGRPFDTGELLWSLLAAHPRE